MIKENDNWEKEFRLEFVVEDCDGGAINQPAIKVIDAIKTLLDKKTK